MTSPRSETPSELSPIQAGVLSPSSLVSAEIDQLTPQLIDWRRDLHAHPETAFTETRTTDLVRTALHAADIDTRNLPRTGLVADIGADNPTHLVGLRADLDALPVPERSGLPYASTVPGVCHACGHDVHTVVVLGAALALKRLQHLLVAADAAVRVVFQPAEEVVPGGAHDLLDAGVLDDVHRIFAVHCDPSVDVGSVGLAAGPITAACDLIDVTLTGPGGHTSRPHLTADLTFALGKVLTDVPAALGRRLDPRAGAALVWGTVSAGNAANVIPATGRVVGTLRMLDADAWNTIGGLVTELIHGVVAPYNVHADVQHVRGVPPVVNDPVAVALLADAVRMTQGPAAAVSTRQSLGGEDFSWMLRDRTGAMARLGTRTPGGATYELHQGDLQIDERAIGVGTRMLATAALLSSTAVSTGRSGPSL
ncbi:amidohydrolase [Rudaeicoccus suwonensis]|uniref:Amidohydrolase n=1 Tax=Rudaeicoccus suwonensis TaxID=657409 RepID=A0A561E8V2_9MICO|nr:amidohydrolase [Rudaeicoccus suwonensis]TWE12036.1 amidohydrolase [Rudaeicoccus suwonensis]